MSEHIKTGEEIYMDINTEFNPNAEEIKFLAKWVSLSWLKEQIEYRKLNRAGEQRQALNWVLSLLEEKPLDSKLQGEPKKLST